MGTNITAGIVVTTPTRVTEARKNLAAEIFRQVDHDMIDLDFHLADRKFNRVLDPDNEVITKILSELGLSGFEQVIEVNDAKRMAVMAIYYDHLDQFLSGIGSEVRVDRENRAFKERTFIERIAEVFRSRTVRIYPQA